MWIWSSFGLEKRKKMFLIFITSNLVIHFTHQPLYFFARFRNTHFCFCTTSTMTSHCPMVQSNTFFWTGVRLPLFVCAVFRCRLNPAMGLRAVYAAMAPCCPSPLLPAASPPPPHPPSRSVSASAFRSRAQTRPTFMLPNVLSWEIIIISVFIIIECSFTNCWTEGIQPAGKASRDGDLPGHSLQTGWHIAEVFW